MSNALSKALLTIKTGKKLTINLDQVLLRFYMGIMVLFNYSFFFFFLGLMTLLKEKNRQVLKALKTKQGMNFFFISIFMYAFKVNFKNKMIGINECWTEKNIRSLQ